jgi:geranylgeranyl pyrophosphate synthase
MKTSSEIVATTPPTIPLLQFFADTQALVNAELDRLLPAESVPPGKVHAAIRWCVLAGGKRFRPLLTLAVGGAFGAANKQLLATACALEMIHTYSLIHDDLPSMDDDDLRRGRATCHIRFGEAIAILAGDALQTLAFKTIADDQELSAVKRMQLVSEIARASGTPDGMVAGQAHDLEAESREVDAEELEQIHRLKTGALITAAARSGAIIADASASELDAITDYSAQLGLLFQITDDLLDITATAETLGKTPGKDLRSSKATYPALYGIPATRMHLLRAHQATCDSLDTLTQPTELLRAIADFILEREA